MSGSFLFRHRDKTDQLMILSKTRRQVRSQALGSMRVKFMYMYVDTYVSMCVWTRVGVPGLGKNHRPHQNTAHVNISIKYVDIYTHPYAYGEMIKLSDLP